MAWEILAGYALEKALDAGTRIAAKGIQLFSVKQARGWRPPLAERHLTLSGQQLLDAYEKDAPIDAEFAGQRYVLPASLDFAPRAHGELDEQGLMFAMVNGDFQLDEALADYVAPIKKAAGVDARLFDGKVTRLGSFTVDGVSTLLPASYFDALATNFAMDHRPTGRAESLRQLLHGRTHSSGALSASKLVNHVGVVCMIEAADGMLIAQRRSSKVANRPGGISASVSGAVNFTDFRTLGAQPFGLSALAGSVFRETLEEIGVEPHDIRFLGLLREFLRGGKPEMYFYARSAASTQRILDRSTTAEGRSETTSIKAFEFHSERVGVDDASRYAFQQRAKGILDVTGADANFTFIAGVLLASKHVLRCAV